MYRLRGDKLISIFSFFSSDQYLLIKHAVISKYGPPLEAKPHDYRNKAGASFQGEIAVWERPDSKIELDEVQVGTVDRGEIQISDPMVDKADAAEELKKATADF
ncbi:MAG: hypothetical protein WAL56_12455 [Candidatus Sulfotelmatobacter sp.]